MADETELEESEAERLWLAEVQKRLEDYRAGRIKTVSAEEVAAKAEKLFQQRLTRV